MANDPYKVLGIDPTATDEEVKKAYRELAKKYHPDNYVNTPLADLAEEKMKEINEAYETVRKLRKEGARPASDGNVFSESGFSGNTNGDSRFAEIRSYIEANNFYEAEIRLNSVPPAARSAEWYFLKGVVFRARGWYFETLKYFEAAHQMDHTNEEYRMALESIRNAAEEQNRRQRRADVMCDVCDLCGMLLFTDCCCDCLGGSCC